MRRRHAVGPTHNWPRRALTVALQALLLDRWRTNAMIHGPHVCSASPTCRHDPAPTRKGNTMIEVENVRKRYGDKLAVDGLSFIVQPGIVTGFLGRNGAGKSTTMRMI